MVQRRSHMRGLCRSPIFLALGRGLFFAALLTLGLLAFVGVLGCSTLWRLTGGLLLLTYADAVIHIGQNSFIAGRNLVLSASMGAFSGRLSAQLCANGVDFGRRLVILCATKLVPSQTPLRP
jgi:hypothetical protein